MVLLVGIQVCGLIRGPRGELHELFSARCGNCSCTRVELLGVLRGLAVAWDAGHKRVQLSVDSKVVGQLLVDTAIPNSPFFHIVRECRSILRRQGWEVTVQHCYREANRVADWLANFGVDMEQRFTVLRRSLRIFEAFYWRIWGAWP